MFRASCLCYLSILTAVNAAVIQQWPFNSQLPLVARIGTPYKFQLASNTFTSTDNEAISYSLQNAPSWLSIDSSSGLLHGTPNSQTSEFEFLIDANGTTDQCKLQVSSNSGPKSKDTIRTQLASFGSLKSNGLVLLPGENFSISFEKSETFDAQNGSIAAYYGVSVNHTALPPWIVFKESDENLTFGGTAPNVLSEIAPPIQYIFTIIATDYEGYTGAEASFELNIGAHTLTTDITDAISVNLTGAPNKFFNQTLPLDRILLDKAPLTKPNITKLMLNASEAPSWVKIDTNNVGIYGNISESFENATFSVTVVDQYQDSVTIPYHLFRTSTKPTTHNSSSTVLLLDNSTSIGPINATFNHFFNYTLPNSIFHDKSETVVNAFFDSMWLSFNATNLTFVGEAPASFDPIEISLSAYPNNTNSKRDLTNQIVFTITGVQPVAHKKSKIHKLAIILGIVIPVSVLLLGALLIALLVAYRRRRLAKFRDSGSISTIGQGEYDQSGLEKQNTTQASFKTADQDLDLSLAKTISNHSENDGSKYSKQDLVPSLPGSRDSEHGNWRVIRDASGSLSSLNSSNDRSSRIRHLSDLASNIISSAKREVIQSDVESVSSSLTDVEFNEKFDDSDYGDHDKAISSPVHHNSNEVGVGVSRMAHQSSSSGSLAAITKTARLLIGDNASNDSLHQAKNFFKGKLAPAAVTVPQSQRVAESAATSNVRVPRKSWRHVVESTRSRFNGGRHESINSLATVSTDELFSVRVANEQQQTADFEIDNTRDDSGIIKRLDSDGNVVEGMGSSPSSSDVVSSKLTSLTPEKGRNRVISQDWKSVPPAKQMTLLSYSEQSRAQKASHSRKRNISQTYSSSSNSHSYSKSSSSQSPDKTNGISSHLKDDSFSIDVLTANPLPVIYSPDLESEVPERDPRRFNGYEINLKLPEIATPSDSSIEIESFNDSQEGPPKLVDFRKARTLASHIVQHHKRSHSSMGRSDLSSDVVYDYTE